MKKTNIGNIEIIIEPEPEMKFFDAKDLKITFGGHEVIGFQTTDEPIIIEPGRARKIYNKLRRFLK